MNWRRNGHRGPGWRFADPGLGYISPFGACLHVPFPVVLFSCSPEEKTLTKSPRFGKLNFVMKERIGTVLLAFVVLLGPMSSPCPCEEGGDCAPGKPEASPPATHCPLAGCGSEKPATTGSCCDSQRTVCGCHINCQCDISECTCGKNSPKAPAPASSPSGFPDSPRLPALVHSHPAAFSSGAAKSHLDSLFGLPASMLFEPDPPLFLVAQSFRC